MDTGGVDVVVQNSAEPAHFSYADATVYEADQLLQGDVLKRTPALEAVLSEVHPHFHHHNKNLFFMVQTQSCDLVRRDAQQPNALYVNIAPVRSIDEVLSREVAGLELAGVRSEIPLLTQRSRAKLADFTRRLLNNNLPQYFYLEGAGTQLGLDCCAFPRLSIPIKTDLHYQTCLDAKILQLNDAFQAKLGSLIGQLYSRVGTKDWSPEAMETKVSGMLTNLAQWIPDDKVKHLKSEFETRAQVDAAHVLTAAEITTILRSAPNLKKVVQEKVVEIAVQSLGLDETASKKLMGRLKADPVLNKAFA